MIIHIVKPGETLNSIAELYNISAERLMLENDIDTFDELAIGQSLVILFPKDVYIVQSGDTLYSIAKKNNLSVIELLRNNPYLSDRRTLLEGESLVIQYESDRYYSISTAGYVFPYIDRDVLRKTLPFLTYMTVFNYNVTIDGDVVGDNDADIIELAKSYKVAPLMFVSTMTLRGIKSEDIAFKIINNTEIQYKIIQNVITILKRSGYYGVNILINALNASTIDKLLDFLSEASKAYHSEGFRVVATVTPEYGTDSNGIVFNEIDYSRLLPYVDAIVFTTYEWGRTYGCPSPLAPINVLQALLDYAVKLVPASKISLGLIPIGYDWPIPYIQGYTQANAVTMKNAIQIAIENDIPIQYSEVAKAPYFFYMSDSLHIVWFKDARTFSAFSDLVLEFSIQGISTWTIMNYNAQLWQILNNRFYIENVYDAIIE